MYTFISLFKNELNFVQFSSIFLQNIRYQSLFSEIVIKFRIIRIENNGVISKILHSKILENLQYLLFLYVEIFTNYYAQYVNNNLCKLLLLTF